MTNVPDSFRSLKQQPQFQQENRNTFFIKFQKISISFWIRIHSESAYSYIISSSNMWGNFALTSRNVKFKVPSLRALWPHHIQTTGRDATVEHILSIVALLSSATTSSSLLWSKMNYLCIAHAAALWKRQWTLMVEKWKQQKISCFVAGPPSVNLIIFFVCRHRVLLLPCCAAAVVAIIRELDSR